MGNLDYFQHTSCSPFGFQSPGRDSIGHDSTASYVTTGSSVSSGCRNSTTSIDSGRESNSIMSTFSSQGGHRMHPHQRHAAISSGSKPGCHSSSSSLGSIDRGEDAICTLNVHELVENGMQVKSNDDFQNYNLTF